jgi:hypothetical protein
MTRKNQNAEHYHSRNTMRKDLAAHHLYYKSTVLDAKQPTTSLIYLEKLRGF